MLGVLALLMGAARRARGLALGAVAIVDGAAFIVAAAPMPVVCRVLVWVLRCGVELRHFLREFCLFQLRPLRLRLLKAGECR